MTARVQGLAEQCREVVNPASSSEVDPQHDLGAGERSVFAWALAASSPALCILDDAAARREARRLGLTMTSTLGLILRAKVDGRVAEAAPVIRDAIEAGLYLEDAIFAAALRHVGESWS